MNRFFYLIPLVLLFILGGCAKDEVVTTATISGFVTDYTKANTPIAGATVTISSKGIARTTGSDGRYEFLDIEPGTYSLQVIADGFQAGTKQISVYAAETAALDFQLYPASKDVEITPQMLSFGPQNDKMTFSIKNKSTSQLQYSITNNPSYIKVYPSYGSVAAKGVQTVSVELDRSSLTDDETCQLIVAIGNDSYPVNISINSQEVSQKLYVSPALLDFGTNYSELQFTIKNVGKSGDLSWNINQPSDKCLSVIPSSGVTAMGQSTQVSVKLNRKELVSDLQTFVNVVVPGGSVSVQIIAKKDGQQGGGGSQTGDGDIVVKSNLLAYYTFDNGTMDDMFEYEMHGQLYNEPSFISDTPDGNGQALFLNGIKKQNAIIPYQPFEGRNAYSVCFWIKDPGVGTIFCHNRAGDDTCGPALVATEAGNLQFCGGFFYYDTHKIEFDYKYKALQDGNWHMLAITKSVDLYVNLYVDGVKVDTGKLNTDLNRFGVNLQFGGNSSFKIDNIRLYANCLKIDEITEIYKSEK